MTEEVTAPSGGTVAVTSLQISVEISGKPVERDGLAMELDVLDASGHDLVTCRVLSQPLGVSAAPAPCRIPGATVKATYYLGTAEVTLSRAIAVNGTVSLPARLPNTGGGGAE